MEAVLIQAILRDLGYAVGAVDGVLGQQTQSAITAFQSDFGLTADGSVGKETEKALRHACAYGVDKKQTTQDGWSALKYISKAEFRCTCRGKYCNGFPVEPSLKTAQIDNAIREHFGKPLTITSGIRCPKRNAEVGGVSNSQHLNGIATDIQVQGVSPSDVAAYAETLMPDYGGIGIYDWGVHIDTRATKSRWKG